MTDPRASLVIALQELELSPVLNPGAQPLVLTGQQRALLQALKQKEAALAVMYRGGLIVLADVSNPDRFSLSAHAMRELMEKLPKYLDVSTKAQQERLKDKVYEVGQSFHGMQQRTGCFNASAGWDGAIDGHLRRFLLRLVKFFDWFAAHHPRRRDELHGVLVRLDGSGRALPASLASLNLDAWEKMRDFFVNVAHHRKPGDEEEFRLWLDALERFLLDRLVPRTFEDFADIDALLGEEDTHA